MTEEACINYETEYNFKKWDLILANAVVYLSVLSRIDLMMTLQGWNMLM